MKMYEIMKLKNMVTIVMVAYLGLLGYCLYLGYNLPYMGWDVFPIIILPLILVSVFCAGFVYPYVGIGLGILYWLVVIWYSGWELWPLAILAIEPLISVFLINRPLLLVIFGGLLRILFPSSFDRENLAEAHGGQKLLGILIAVTGALLAMEGYVEGGQLVKGDLAFAVLVPVGLWIAFKPDTWSAIHRLEAIRLFIIGIGLGYLLKPIIDGTVDQSWGLVLTGVGAIVLGLFARFSVDMGLYNYVWIALVLLFGCFCYIGLLELIPLLTEFASEKATDVVICATSVIVNGLFLINMVLSCRVDKIMECFE